MIAYAATRNIELYSRGSRALCLAKQNAELMIYCLLCFWRESSNICNYVLHQPLRHVWLHEGLEVDVCTGCHDELAVEPICEPAWQQEES